MPGQQAEVNLRTYLTVGQAAAFLGVSRDTLRNWDRRGKVAAHRHPVNGYRLYRREDLAALVSHISAQKKPAPPSARREAAQRGDR